MKQCDPNPNLDDVIKIKIPKGTREIISEGGGSTIDVGKWIARDKKLKHTAIPTTAGTGSEVTRFCVLNVEGKKTTFEDEKFIPDAYILDPNKVVSLPTIHTVSSGLDALSQAMEASWSIKKTPESYMYSQSAISMIPKNLLISKDKPENLKARMNMLIAANLSGRAINITRTNVCHAISYPLTDLYGIPHGIACAMSLGYFAKKMGIEIDDYLKMFNLNYKIDPEKVANIAIKSPKLKDFPKPITKEDIIHSLS